MCEICYAKKYFKDFSCASVPRSARRESPFGGRPVGDGQKPLLRFIVCSGDELSTRREVI